MMVQNEQYFFKDGIIISTGGFAKTIKYSVSIAIKDQSVVKLNVKVGFRGVWKGLGLKRIFVVTKIPRLT